MKYRDRETGQIYTLFELQRKFSNTSFPERWSTETYDYTNVDPVLEVAQPSPTLQHSFEYDGVQLVDGIWTEVWKAIPIIPQEPTLSEIEEKWVNIRNHRNMLLGQTDYIELPSTPITDECRSNFMIYRQQLRDITSQSDPYNINWPVIPEYIKQ